MYHIWDCLCWTFFKSCRSFATVTVYSYLKVYRFIYWKRFSKMQRVNRNHWCFDGCGKIPYHRPGLEQTSRWLSERENSKHRSQRRLPEAPSECRQRTPRATGYAGLDKWKQASSRSASRHLLSFLSTRELWKRVEESVWHTVQSFPIHM